MDHRKEIEQIRNSFQHMLNRGMEKDEIRLAILGRKGMLTAVLRDLSNLPPDQRAAIGSEANALKVEVEQRLLEIEGAAKEDPDALPDSTVPPYTLRPGTIHPISAMVEEMVRIFKDLSFEVVEGNEIVSDKENFEALNLTKDHPARDSHDSFFITDDVLLRTQTTAVQVLEMADRMKRGDLPIRIVMPGKTYRRESDQTHSAMFHQIDAVMVDTQTTFADLKGSLDYFAKRLFGDSVETRFRPHYFPFTEPSAEIDIRWKGETSSEGKHTGWLEMGGCGMIHPNVLKRAGINPRIYQGWAFGMGIERPIMVRNQVPDLRRFFENSLQFLEQFNDQV